MKLQMLEDIAVINTVYDISCYCCTSYEYIHGIWIESLHWKVFEHTIYILQWVNFSVPASLQFVQGNIFQWLSVTWRKKYPL